MCHRLCNAARATSATVPQLQQLNLGDISNAFNSCDRALMLSKLYATPQLSSLFCIAHFAYSSPSTLLLQRCGGVDRVRQRRAAGRRAGPACCSACTCASCTQSWQQRPTSCCMASSTTCTSSARRRGDEGAYGTAAAVARPNPALPTLMKARRLCLPPSFALWPSRPSLSGTAGSRSWEAWWAETMRRSSRAWNCLAAKAARLA
jgi:hypothetical protein